MKITFSSSSCSTDIREKRKTSRRAFLLLTVYVSNFTGIPQFAIPYAPLYILIPKDVALLSLLSGFWL